MTVIPDSTAADPQQIIAELERRLDERTFERDESRQQQKATAEVLKVISSSAFDLQAVFETVVESSAGLARADRTRAFIYRLDGELLRLAAAFNAPRELKEYVEQNPVRPGRHSGAARAALERRTIHIPDVLADPEYTFGAKSVETVRTLLAVPILKGDDLLGVLLLYLLAVAPFTERQIAQVEAFADQAAIAIENARLFDQVQAKTRDLSESLQQQTATADVLKVISRSAFDLQVVLDTLVKSAVGLCDSDEGTIWQPQESHFVLTANCGLPPHKKKFLEGISLKPGNPTPGSQTLLTGKTLHVHDVLADPAYPVMGDPDPARTRLHVPLLRNGKAIGLFILSRREARPFGEKQIELVQTFADQAVIAIENARLFNENKEALERQTATADILKVIASSPSDVQPVFEAIAASAKKLIGGFSAVVHRFIGDDIYLVAFTPINPEADATLQASFPRPISQLPVFLQVRDGETVEFADTEAEDVPRLNRDLARLRGYRSMLFTPLMSNGSPIGMISVTREEPGSFANHHVELVRTFADQAVIAIENVRLFDEVQARTKELAASLDELRTAQDRLVQTEKLASLGQLTAGIAHEIKNPLNFVNNFSAVSAELTDELNVVLKPVVMDGKVREDVDEITGLLKDNLEKVVQHGKRADSIVKNMLLHSREGAGEQRPADINALLDESLNLAYHGARAEKPGFNITLHRDFDPVAGLVDVYPQEVTRVLLNLIANGFYAATRRAADSGDGFEPTLRAATKDLGDRLEIRIRDNGTGIAPDVKEKIFNPFFTTKPAGEGTGLGLSMSHDIVVKQHGGTINVVSELGIFTEFIITLPRTITPQKTAGGTI